MIDKRCTNPAPAGTQSARHCARGVPRSLRSPAFPVSSLDRPRLPAHNQHREPAPPPRPQERRPLHRQTMPPTTNPSKTPPPTRTASATTSSSATATTTRLGSAPGSCPSSSPPASALASTAATFSPALPPSTHGARRAGEPPHAARAHPALPRQRVDPVRAHPGSDARSRGHPPPRHPSAARALRTAAPYPRPGRRRVCRSPTGPSSSSSSSPPSVPARSSRLAPPSTPTPSRRPATSHLPFPRNACFAGREEDLKALARLLIGQDASVAIGQPHAAIPGLG